MSTAEKIAELKRMTEENPDLLDTLSPLERSAVEGLIET